MQYGKCRCGKVEYWDSGYAIHPCQGCEVCNTTIARDPLSHKVLIPHTPKPQFNTNTGELSHYICSICYERCTETGSQL